MEDDITYEFTEEYLFLITVSMMIDTMIEQLMWLKAVVDEEMEKEDTSAFMNVAS